MRSSTFLLALFTVIVNTGVAFGQLVVNNVQSPQQLVESVLIGQGVEVSNIQFTGDPEARGYFNGTNSNIGLSEGVILSTGKVTDAIGPNGTPFSDQGTDFSRPGYAALTAISGSTAGTRDASILEFDFVPSSDTVRFRYKFASNEYMLYVGAGVNDVFAFLISGPGITGEQNIALIPGTQNPVTIDNVNANQNAQYYIDNENPPGQTVEYNGFTTVFTAQAVVIPCQTYHIKLAIADAGDGLYDSAVFLEAGSFSSPTISVAPSANFSSSTTGLELIEGCSELTLTFERSAPFDSPLTVDLTLSGTAAAGSDYTGIGTSVTFPAGQGSLSVTIPMVDDGVAEGVETATIAILDVNPCSTGPLQEVTFTIQDAVRPSITSSPPVTFFCPQEYDIITDVTGGYAPLIYSWSGLPGETGTSITVSPLSTTNYTVTVTDQCGFTSSASTNITMTGYVPVSVSVADAQICNGGDAEVSAIVTGGAGTIIYQWDSGVNTPSYVASPSVETQVWVQVTDSCGFSASDTAVIRVDDFQATFTSEHIRQDTYVFTNTSEDTQNLNWDFGDGNSSNEPGVTHTYAEEGEYTVTLTAVNRNGCESDSSITVKSYPPMRVYMPNSFTPNGDGINDTFGMTGEAYQGYVIRIFTRWGQELYKGVHYDANAWDGTCGGELVPRGLYLWKIEVLPFAGMNVLKEGTVMVLPD